MSQSMMAVSTGLSEAFDGGNIEPVGQYIEDDNASIKVCIKPDTWVDTHWLGPVGMGHWRFFVGLYPTGIVN